MTAPPRGSLAAGFAALSHGKLILLLALTTAALGLAGAMPLTPAIAGSIAGTLAGDHLIRNAATLAPTDFLDFLREQAPAVRGARRAALFAGVLGVVLQAFFAGGIVAVLGRGRFSFSQFFEPARRNLWHNTKCLLLFAASAGIALGAWFGGVAAVAKKALESVPPDAPVRTLVFWVTIVGGVLLYAGLSLLYDFARAARRYSPTIGAWRAFRFAWRALAGARLRALLLFLFWLFAGGGVAAGAVLAAWCMPAVSLPAVAALLALQFAALWLRAAVRVGAWGSYIGFLDRRGRPALSALSAPRPAAASLEPVRT